MNSDVVSRNQLDGMKVMQIQAAIQTAGSSDRTESLGLWKMTAITLLS